MTPEEEGKGRGICICGHPSDAHCLEAAGSDNKQGWKPASETKHGLGSCGWTGDGAFCTCEEYREEGPPTLRECRDLIYQIATGELKYEVVDDEITGIPDYLACEAPNDIVQKSNEVLARLTDEALERDEEIHGNSPEHWYSKAMAYKGIVFEVCEAFRKLGYKGDFQNLDTLAERLSAHVKVIQRDEKRTAALERKVKRLAGNVLSYLKWQQRTTVSPSLVKYEKQIRDAIDALTPAPKKKEVPK